MPASPEPPFGIVRVAPFAGFVHRFDDLIGSATTMALYFIHSRRWRENHDAAIKGFLGRPGTSLEAFLPDLESHELMFSLGKHFEDGPLIPALVADAYRCFARLAGRNVGNTNPPPLFVCSAPLLRAAGERLRQTRSRLVVRSLPDLLLLPVRRARGDRPVFQHDRQEGAAGVRGHRARHSGNVPRGRHGRPQEGMSQAGHPGSRSRDRERRAVTRPGNRSEERRVGKEQLLTSTLTDPADVVRRLGAVQAQDYAGAKWGVGARTRGAVDAVVERAVSDGAILRTHVLRPTWTFAALADIRWMLALPAARVKAAIAYYDRQLGLDAAMFRRSRTALTQIGRASC